MSLVVVVGWMDGWMVVMVSVISARPTDKSWLFVKCEPTTTSRSLV